MTTRKTSTTSRSTTARKTSTRKTTAKAAPARKTTARKTSTTRKKATPKVAPVVVEAAKPVLTGPTMRKKELIEAVVAQSGVKKKDAKPVVEAMLTILGDALREGRELNLQPLGKMMVRRSKKLQNGTVMMAKLRLKDKDATAMTDGDDAVEIAAEAPAKAAE